MRLASARHGCNHGTAYGDLSMGIAVDYVRFENVNTAPSITDVGRGAVDGAHEAMCASETAGQRVASIAVESITDLSPSLRCQQADGKSAKSCSNRALDRKPMAPSPPCQPKPVCSLSVRVRRPARRIADRLVTTLMTLAHAGVQIGETGGTPPSPPSPPTTRSSASPKSASSASRPAASQPSSPQP